MTTRVSVFFLGGTISMTDGEDGALVSRLGPADLIASAPALGGLDVDLDVRDFRRVPGAHLRYDDVVQLLAEAESGDADGLVVVQGTDTIEETSFLIDLLWPHETPIVLTGAMRHPQLAGADGPANLLAAVTVAASARSRGLGALVVLNDEIHAARHVAKRHTTSLAAFVSPNTGPIGRLVEGEPMLTSAPRRGLVFRRPDRIAVSVPVVVTAFDDDGLLLHALHARCDGLVVAGLGAGHVPDRNVEVLTEIAARVPVVLASRTGGGPVLTRTYGFAGSETDLIARGLIPAGLLDAYKARILLTVLLATGHDRARIVSAFSP